MAIVYGTNSSETLNKSDGVTESADTIYGFGGNDTISGFGGNDLIIGGAGGDTIHGGMGFDTAFYTDSTEAVIVSLQSGAGAGGTAEDDTLISIENLYGSAYDDTLEGNDASNALSGMQGDDFLKGGGGSDTLSGGSGNDDLLGGAGADTLYGGDGSDSLSYGGSPQGVIVSLLAHSASGGHATGDVFSGIEHLFGSSHDDDLYGDDGANDLNGANGNDTLKGFGGVDFLIGGDGDDVLFGMSEDDTIEGGLGNDTLNGGTGTDTMAGGIGNDTYIVDSYTDTIIESGGQGIDTVLTSVEYFLPEGADIETLATTDENGTAEINLIGNSSGNTIIGNDGDNWLIGNGGTDLLVGRDGNDYYGILGEGTTTIVEMGGQGTDAVLTLVTYTLPAGADIEYLVPGNDAGAIDLTGNSAGNFVGGNDLNNVLNGGFGNDELTGLDGQDSFLFDTMLDAAFNVDTIADFNVADDTIRLDQDIFSSSLGLGNISAGEFVIGTAAQDANDRIIYDSNTGALYYDSDGNGGTAAVQFAELNPGLALTYLDLLVV